MSAPHNSTGSGGRVPIVRMPQNPCQLEKSAKEQYEIDVTEQLSATACRNLSGEGGQTYPSRRIGGIKS